MALLIVAGCGNYTSLTQQAREEFYAGKYTDSAKRLEEGAHKDGVDQLLFLLDRALALHHASDYAESNKDFAIADKLSEIKDYTSLSGEALSVLTNDRILPYKGEEFEKVLISQYMAMNYLMLHKYEDALVECRRVNHKLRLLIQVGKRNYQLNPMASYMAAMMFEHEREWSDSYVDYQAVHALIPEFPGLGEDLYRLAWRNHIMEDMERWTKEYGLTDADHKRIRATANDPEVILILEVGRSPEKKPNPFWHALPKYFARPYPVSYAQVSVDGQDRGRSNSLYNVEARAMENLDEKYGGILAKRIGGVVAKEVIGNEVGRHTDPLVGFLVKVGLYAIDKADLRSWLTLPRDFQVFRTKVKAGADSKLVVEGRGFAGEPAASEAGKPEKSIHFESNAKGQKIFIPIRL